MKINKTDLMLFCITVLAGIFLVNSLGSKENKSSWSSLSAYDYKEAIDERNNLYKEISQLEEQNNELQNTINEYSEDDTDNSKIIETMKSQLLDYNRLYGAEAVKGKGVVLEINDGDIDSTKDTFYERWRKTFHDNDMAMVINEIRASGAEAFGLNNKRIMPFTGVSCNWAYLGFEDDSLEYAPFYIFIIGDPDTIEASLNSDDSYIMKLKIRGLEVSIRREEEIILKPENQKTEVKFMEILDNK